MVQFIGCFIVFILFQTSMPVTGTNDDLLSALPVIILGIFLGLASCAGPGYFISVGKPLGLPPGEALVFGAIAIQFTSMICPRIMVR